MKVLEKAAATGAIVAALSALACCLPWGFFGAAALASVSVRVALFRPWLLAAAFVLLGVGFVQLYRSRNQCTRRSPLSIGLFWIAVVVVALVILFPQLIASWIAG